MSRRFRLLICALAIATPLPAFAQPKGGAAARTSDAAAETQTEEQARAQQHFQRAKDLYQTGAYREAIAELEAARGLDPKAKELVFNLAIVHEKLAKYDEALTFLRQYMDMDGVTAAERAKAESFIKRIEGAKRAMPTPAPETAPTAPTEPKAKVEEPPPQKPEHGRIDTATIAAASVAGVGLVVGTVFGIRAAAIRPTNFVTGRDGTYADLQDKTDSAHTSAIIADVGFGVGIVGALVAGYLYFGRTKEPARPTPPATTSSSRPVALSAAPTLGGGYLVLGGSFQ